SSIRAGEPVPFSCGRGTNPAKSTRLKILISEPEPPAFALNFTVVRALLSLRQDAPIALSAPLTPAVDRLTSAFAEALAEKDPLSPAVLLVSRESSLSRARGAPTCPLADSYRPVDGSGGSQSTGRSIDPRAGGRSPGR